MRCANCRSTTRVVNGLCVHCRFGARGQISEDSFRSGSFVSGIILNLTVLGLLASLVITLGSKYDFIEFFWTKRTAPGILAPAEPQQTSTALRPWNHKGHLFRALAAYQVQARVLLKNNYWFSPDSEISPIDLTLGWGPMSDQSFLDQLSLSSGYRSYSWSAEDNSLSADYINLHAANHHIIPENDKVMDMLRKLAPGDLVELSGYLVEISRADGWSWKSSLSREDAGGGACELMWVEDVRIKPAV